MTTTTTTTTTIAAQTVDRLISGIAKRNAGLLHLADRAAIAIIQNPADLAGRAITLLEAMAGIKSQKNILAFFDDYLPNEVVEKKSGGFILGKKRPDWVEPALPESGLSPCTYVNTEKAALAKAERAEKMAALKAKKEEDTAKATENHNQRESDLVARERELDAKIAAVHAVANARIGKAEMATHDARADLKAESDRLKVALSEKGQLERELAMANRRIQELETELAAMRKAMTATANTAPVVAPVVAVPAVPVTRKGRKKTA